LSVVLGQVRSASPARPIRANVGIISPNCRQFDQRQAHPEECRLQRKFCHIAPLRERKAVCGYFKRLSFLLLRACATERSCPPRRALRLRPGSTLPSSDPVGDVVCTPQRFLNLDLPETAIEGVIGDARIAAKCGPFAEAASEKPSHLAHDP